MTDHQEDVESQKKRESVPWPKNGEGILRFCAAHAGLIDRDAEVVPAHVQEFALAILSEVYVVLGQNLETTQAEIVAKRIGIHLLGTELK